ncbi:MAG: ABC transporter ATP-binding protein, partial [Clostridia bacterium]|nr:ABC transporter ATP-binding protein [Clostridia bacterium]
MLELKDIVKIYETKDLKVEALKGVNLKFRKNEFVSILGPSGCGKTTFLNIVGGLDKYTSGDLVINGKSTKDFNDRDWDAYRNHTIGFVFQTYNLIPHQTVLQNVEIALTLSGVSKEERKRRAIDALEKVGLGDKIKSKPNQLSGGQMQRVAIARALVNDPDVVLADEPTGALDSKTSVQVMELLKEVAKDRLVIMVTHNPDLANEYSTRIIKFLDGELIDDSAPFDGEEINIQETSSKEVLDDTIIETPQAESENVVAEVVSKKSKRKKKERAFKKTTMSFWTAFKLSLTNLFTKKGRTILTSFAGSIGIIGIALILAVSQGMTTYINHVQESTLASYPITLEKETIDMTSLLQSFMNVGTSELNHEKDAIYRDPVIGEMVDALSKVQTNKNDLTAFKSYIESEMAKEGSKLQQSVTGIQYTYDLELDIYTRNVDGQIVKSDTGELMSKMVGDYMIGVMQSQGGATQSSGSSESMSSMGSSMFAMDIWQEILPGMDGSYINNLVYEQYELIDGGAWPKAYNEIVLVVNEKNEIDDLTLYALGLIDKTEIDAIIDAAVNGTTIEHEKNRWSYDDIKARTFKTILPSNKYVYSEATGTYVDIGTYAESDPLWMSTIYDNASLELKITGIIRAKDDSDATLLASGIGYTSKLTEYIINESVNSDVVKAQKENPTVDLLTGKPFKSNTGVLTAEQKGAA